MLNLSTLLLLAVSLLSLPLVGAEVQSKNTSIKKDSLNIVGNLKGAEVFRYWLKKPSDSLCTSSNAAYFHPLKTPSGLTVTDLAPDDHLHHRGIFISWLEVRNKEGEGDFWGWGKWAPIENRIIKALPTATSSAGPEKLSFSTQQNWLAEETPILKEKLDASFYPHKDVHVLDLSYRFDAKSDTALGHQAFSGFTARLRKDYPIIAYDSRGKVEHPAPHHLKPESNWPHATWYAFEFQLDDGKKAGVAVMVGKNHPKTTWHNLVKIGMINPCIVAPEPFSFKASDGLKLNYRVVTFDGPVPTSTLDALSASFQSE